MSSSERPFIKRFPYTSSHLEGHTSSHLEGLLLIYFLFTFDISDAVLHATFRISKE